MKFLVALFLSFFFLFSSYAGENLSFFRAAFKGIKNYKTAEAFLETEVSEDDYRSMVTINSYKAACKMMMAQYVYNPFSKYSWFKKGEKLLEQTIVLNRNVENTYLRLIVQLHVPSFLGYTKEIESDTKFILNNLEKVAIPDATKRYILKNLIETKKEEVESLRLLARKYGVI